MMKNKWINKNDLYVVLLVIVVIAFFYKCPYDYFFGISCPGCGMTRACWALLKLDLEQAMYYHPLCILMPVLALGYILDRFHFVTIETKYKKVIAVMVCILFLGIYMIRMFQENDVVRFHPEDSFIKNIIDQIRFLIKNATS